MKERLHFSWEETGDLDIEIVGDLSATLQYGPSKRFIEETLAKFRKKPANQPNGVRHTNYKGANKVPLKQVLEPHTETGTKEIVMENVNGEYGRLSKELQEQYKAGDFAYASLVLSDMANIHKKEGNRQDELKALMLAYYFDMSGLSRQPFINPCIVERLREAFTESGISQEQLQNLYFDTVREDTLPRHSLTLKGSLRVFLYCILGKDRKVTEVISHL